MLRHDINQVYWLSSSHWRMIIAQSTQDEKLLQQGGKEVRQPMLVSFGLGHRVDPPLIATSMKELVRSGALHGIPARLGSSVSTRRRVVKVAVSMVSEKMMVDPDFTPYLDVRGRDCTFLGAWH